MQGPMLYVMRHLQYPNQNYKQIQCK